MNTKGLRVEVKDADKGEVSAVFSTFNVVDSDRDVTEPGAFSDGAEVVMSAYGHESWGGALPVGKGVISQTETEAIFEGQFFMDVPEALSTFKVIKNLGPMQEWSYGYNVKEHSYGEFEGQNVRFLKQLDVFEVSPVLRGAGINTRTMSAKSGLKFSDEASAAVAAVTALVDRAADVMAKRQEKGKGLGAESVGLLEQVQAELKRFEALLNTEPEPQAGEELEREYLKFLAISHDLAS